jgi:hypothetical protein
MRTHRERDLQTIYHNVHNDFTRLLEKKIIRANGERAE